MLIVLLTLIFLPHSITARQRPSLSTRVSILKILPLTSCSMRRLGKSPRIKDFAWLEQTLECEKGVGIGNARLQAAYPGANILTHNQTAPLITLPGMSE